MAYRMGATIAIWLSTTLMVLRGKAQGREFVALMIATVLCTIAVWIVPATNEREIVQK
jgi:hypothetical protein